MLSALEAFKNLRSCSLVGTLGRIPDLIAAEFARCFYSELCNGWSVGAALHYARRELLKAPLSNPLGILFVSYGGEDVYFTTRADRRSTYIPSGRTVTGKAA
jgi:hypothetical protein